MKWRIVASLAFLGGGVFTFGLLLVLRAFASAMAGMSPVSTAGGSPSMDSWVTALACSYFVIGAVGVLCCKRQATLRRVAVVAHLPLVYLILLVANHNMLRGSASASESILGIGVPVLIYFSPWLVVWLSFMYNQDDMGNRQNITAHQIPPDSPSGRETGED